MIEILYRNAFLLIELNVFEASTSKTTSDDWSLRNEPIADVTSSRMCNTTTLLAIQRKTSPVPIGPSLGFLSNGIYLNASNASNDDDRSVIQCFLMTLVNVLHKSIELLPNWFDVKILFQLSTSRPEDPAAPLVLLSLHFLHLTNGIWWGEFLLVDLVTIILELHLYHVGAFASSDTRFDHLMEEYRFPCSLLKASSHYWYYFSSYIEWIF